MTLLIKPRLPLTINWAICETHVLPIIFFTFFFLYLVILGDLPVIYSCNGFDINTYVPFLHRQELSGIHYNDPDSLSRHFYILELTWTYLKNIMSFPGGLNSFIVTLLIYACHYPLLGAGFLTIIAWIIFFICRNYFQQINGININVWAYIPPVFLLGKICLYNLNFMAYIIPVLGALIVSVVYIRFHKSVAARQLIFFSLLFWLCYYFFQWSCLLFIVFVGFYCYVQRSPNIFSFGIASIGNCVTAFLIDNYVLPPSRVFNITDFFNPAGLPCLICAFIIVSFIFFNQTTSRVLVRWFSFLNITTVPQGFKVAFRGIVLLLLVVFTLFFATNNPINNEIRCISRTLHYLQNKQWPAILKENSFAEFAKFSEPNRFLLIHATNRALYNMGQLGSKMYSYPQVYLSAEPLFLFQSSEIYGFPNWFAALDLFMDLGALNYAEKIAGEALENMGPYPLLLYRRAIIQLAKGNNEAATIYFNKLKTMPFYQKKADMFVSIKPDDTAAQSSIIINNMKKNRDTANCYLYNGNEENILLNLLKSNPRNKMAFEYLMAYYLQKGEMAKIVQHIDWAASFGYTTIPRHWGEALSFYLGNDSLQAVKLRELTIAPETYLELNRFLEDFNRGFNEPAKMAETASLLEQKYGTTYFYYIFKFSSGAK